MPGYDADLDESLSSVVVLVEFISKRIEHLDDGRPSGKGCLLRHCSNLQSVMVQSPR